jgi:hypothetical protein
MDPIGTVSSFIHSVVAWFQGLAPGGFGLLLVPIGILGALALLAARKR